MPRFPFVNPSVSAMGSSPYSALGHRLAAFRGEAYPLHVGDTWMEPAVGCRMQDLTVEENPGMHRYTSVHGSPALIDAIVDRTRQVTGVPTERADVLVTAGATGGLGAVVGGLIAPGDEVLILAPYWPLVAGIVRTFHGVPVAVPFVGEATDPETAVAIVERYRTGRTVALYVNTPNNPTGRVIPEAWLAALAEWSRAHGLWIFADEVYEHYVFDGAHAYVRPMAPERTISIHSCSKAYGMAGNRVGYVVGPSAALEQVRKVSTHTFYSTPTASQIAACRALLGHADTWLAEARRSYAVVGRAAAERLGLPPPEGSTFLFFDVAPHLEATGKTLGRWLAELVEDGLLIAPGDSFGPYPTHVRLCFTAAPPEVTLRGVDVLARHLGRLMGTLESGGSTSPAGA